MFTCEQSGIVAVGVFLVLIRWFSEQNFDAITTESIRVRTGAAGYARLIISKDITQVSHCSKYVTPMSHCSKDVTLQ